MGRGHNSAAWGACGLVLCLWACEGEDGEPQTVEGLAPSGSAGASEAALTRFARRAHLDLTGEVPDQAFLGDTVNRLQAVDNATSERLSLARELVELPSFGANFVSELQGRAFGGSTLADRMDLACIEAAALNEASCAGCGGAAPCECSCSAVAQVVEQRAGLDAAATELTDGLSTAAVERRYADSGAFSAGLLVDGEGQADRLFEAFLGRAAEDSERDNAGNMILYGFVLGQGVLPLDIEAAGLLFGQHGSSREDLLDILFGSEVYREALVVRTFDRYLGRPPSAQELSYFAGELDEEEPDVRELTAQVVASREYFGL